MDCTSFQLSGMQFNSGLKARKSMPPLCAVQAAKVVTLVTLDLIFTSEMINHY